LIKGIPVAKKDTDKAKAELPPEDEKILDVVELSEADNEEATQTEPETASSEDNYEIVEEYDLEHEDHISLSSRILRFLAIFTVGVVVALWAGPKIAPVLPAGLKPVAEFLSPQADISAQIETVEAKLELRIAEIEAANLQQDTIDQIKLLLDQLDAKDADFSTSIAMLSDNIQALQSAFDAVQSEIAEVSARQALTSEGGTVSEEVITQFEEKLAAIIAAQQDLNKSQAQVTEVQQDAASKLRWANAANALSQITDALETGRPFAKALDQLGDINGIVIPTELSDVATQGAPSLFDLKKQLPQLARVAIRADIKARADESILNKFTSFLKSQVGTRSLEPQAGDTMDAVFSRIEGALDERDLSTALAETNALSDLAKETMKDWVAALAKLTGATLAVQSLQQQLTIAQR
jgi:hypothetical protein